MSGQRAWRGAGREVQQEHIAEAAQKLSGQAGGAGERGSGGDDKEHACTDGRSGGEREATARRESRHQAPPSLKHAREGLTLRAAHLPSE